jgi:hypothetical protein
MHRIAAVTCFLLAASPVLAIELPDPSSATGAEVRTNPEQIERQGAGAGLAKVPGAEPIQPKAVQPGEGARDDALHRDQQATETRSGLDPQVPSNELQGRVLTVDRKTGLTSIEVPQGQKVVLQLSEQATASLASGDEVAARMAFSRYPKAVGDSIPPEEGIINTEKLPGELAQKRVSGTVEDLDKSTGAIALVNGTTKLSLLFDPRTIETLERGDQITVEMAVSKQAGNERAAR